MSVVDIFQIDLHTRSKLICDAMFCGLRAAGEKPTIRRQAEYKAPTSRIAVFYGLEGNLPKIFADYASIGTAVYVDLGYWGRHQGGRWKGYHKVAVNSRHPTEYFRRRPHSDARAARLQIRPKPWRDGKHILLAGMGAKGANAEGLHPEQWERDAIAELRKHTGREIVYRPKPSWTDAKPIHGTIFSPRSQDISAVLTNCHAVVTHHSNAAVDALVDGVPAFCWHGVAAPMAAQDLSLIETPLRPLDRESWVADIAYTQWTVDEITRGLAWRHLRSEGLICE